MSILVLGAEHTTDLLTADQILTKLASAEAARDRLLRSYKVTRVYQIKADKAEKSVRAAAEFEFHEPGGKSYRILEEDGPEGLLRRALHKVMQAEVKASKSEEELSVSPQNYTARLLGKEEKNGRLHYVLEVTPRRKSKYLLQGKAWVDAAEFALTRIEGRPTESLSFWVGKPYIEQNFTKVGYYWLLANNKSTVDAKFVGRLEFTIESSDYSVHPLAATSVSSHGKKRSLLN
ncbi:MAG TPA: hypothetical protein VM120_25510 [Bryobacteraceae bacterium]|nr:hypothetical protein [Bryobacteraceae bacterium]